MPVRSTTAESCASIWLLFHCLAATSPAAPVIENTDEPAHGRRIQQLEEMWRIGGLDDEENLLGLIRNVVADEQGNLYLLDTQLIEVLVYRPDGQYLKSPGHEGDGPGKLRRPRDVVLLPDGTVGLMQGFPGRIIKVDRDGLPAGQLLPGGDPDGGGIFALLEVVAAGPHPVMVGAEISRDDRKRTSRSSVASYDSADGTLQQTITRRYESYPRTDLEIEQARTWMPPRGGRNRRQFDVVVEPTMRDIMQMHVDEDGRLWVLNSRGAHPKEPGIHSVWDVFDAEGRFDQEVPLACEGLAIEDGIIFPGHGLVVVVKLFNATLAFRGQAASDADDGAEGVPLEVICYRMTP